MQLIGMLDSPFVRRIAISMKRMGIPFEHRPLSVFRDWDAFRQINPLVKVPTLVLDDGGLMVDSTIILDHLESIVPAGRSLMPTDPGERLRTLQLLGVALVALEKAVQLVYERDQRPAERRHEPWQERVATQMYAACSQLDIALADSAPWLFGGRPTQADITIAVAWRFMRMTLPEYLDNAARPALERHSAAAESLPEFIATPVSA